MSWFKSKTKEEKQISLEERLKELNSKYSSFLDKLCLVDNVVRYYRDFRIKDNKICLSYVDKDSPEGKIFLINYD